MIEEVLGNEVFLQGKYISLGINGSGTLGTKQTAAAGVYTDAVNGFIRLGMVGDMDGFGTGKAATREAMLTGTPQEGFSLGYDIGSSHYVRTNAERTSMRQIADGVTGASSTDTTMTATWASMTTEKVKIDQVMTLADDAKFVRVDVTLVNQTGSAINNVRYMRTIDPDHGPGFSTVNTVVEQGGDGADGALIAAYAAKGSTPLFYYSADDRAKVSTYGLKNFDPYAAAAYNAAQAEGFSKTADESININFNVGTLAAGATTTITFYFGITDNLSATLAAIKSQNGATSDPVPTPAPAPVNHAPVAADDADTTVGTAAATGNVLANDKDADGHALSASLVKGPAHGTLTLAADGSYHYVATKGYAGTDSFTYAASDGKASANATVAISVAAPANSTPTLTADTAATVGTAAATGNVLANDKDADGDTLAASLVKGPAHGTLTLAADGSYHYVADKGYAGTDSFTYAASDGKTSAQANVAITVDAEVPAPAPIMAPTLVQNGSDAANQVLTATSGHDVFYFDNGQASGVDTIQGFDRGDVINLKNALYDGNGDGIVTASKAGFALQNPTGGNALKIAGVASLRLMGVDDDGTVVYASGAARPKGAQESKIGDNRLAGDATDKKAQTFFFDTALDLNLGQDTIVNFGKKDIIVTTEALALDVSGNVVRAADGGITLTGGDNAYRLGELDVFAIGGSAAPALEFDGAVIRDGATYYVYSLDGSAAGVGNLVV